MRIRYRPSNTSNSEHRAYCESAFAMSIRLYRPTAEIKADIRSGDIQEIYKKLFEKKIESNVQRFSFGASGQRSVRR